MSLYFVFNLYCAGIDFNCQDLTSPDSKNIAIAVDPLHMYSNESEKAD